MAIAEIGLTREKTWYAAPDWTNRFLSAWKKEIRDIWLAFHYFPCKIEIPGTRQHPAEVARFPDGILSEIGQIPDAYFGKILSEKSVLTGIPLWILPGSKIMVSIGSTLGKNLSLAESTTKILLAEKNILA